MSRQRTQFSEIQSRVLENKFKECHYPSTDEKKTLAILLELPENRITVWFQNRRAKQRRHSKKEAGGSPSRKHLNSCQYSTSGAPKNELTIDTENSSYSWINNNPNYDWKVSVGNSSSIETQGFLSTFDNFTNETSIPSTASNFLGNAFQPTQPLTGNQVTMDSEINSLRPFPFDSSQYIPYSVANQTYIHPHFINQEAMRMAFHSSSSESQPFFQ